MAAGRYLVLPVPPSSSSGCIGCWQSPHHRLTAGLAQAYVPHPSPSVLGLARRLLLAGLPALLVVAGAVVVEDGRVKAKQLGARLGEPSSLLDEMRDLLAGLLATRLAGRGRDQPDLAYLRRPLFVVVGVSSRPPRNYVANYGQRFVIVFCGIGSTHRNLEDRAPGRGRHAVVGFSIRYQRAIPLQPIVRAWCSKATKGACEIPTSVRLP